MIVTLDLGNRRNTTMIHSPFALGLAFTLGIIALLPDATEKRGNTPWSSIALAIMAGIEVYAAF